DYDSTVKHDDIADYGALRPGGALNLLSFEAFGLLSQYASVGILMSIFGSLQYPVFQNYLHMEGYQTASYSVLTSLGWSSKIFFGILSDCFPLFGYHRRPYIVLGWLVCAASCLTMAITPFPAPYYGKPSLVNVPLATISSEDLPFINQDAPASGSIFIVLTMVASLGYVLADVAADAMVVHYAQREPAAIRGRIQTAIYLTRDSFSIVPMLVVGFCLNDYKYGGSFSWSLDPNVLYGALVVPCGLAAYTALVHLVEEPRVDRLPFPTYVANAWTLLQKRVVWQIAAFNFCFTLFFGYTSTLNDPVASIWIEIHPLVNTLFGILYQCCRVLAMFVIGRHALAWDWRVAIAVSTVGLVVVDTMTSLLAIWAVVRDQYVQSAVGALEAFPIACVFLFGSYLIVEIAEVGNEGLVFALLTTCSNLASPLSTVLAKTVDSFFMARLSDIQRDDHAARWQVSYSFIAAAAIRCLSMVFLVLLPRQKVYVQVLKQVGGSNPVAAATVLAIFFIGYVWNLLTNLLSVFPTTNCLRIAGGKGC
ncbi:hypothetical protein As57867_004172, partial [Aphanomyces stellatus]